MRLAMTSRLARIDVVLRATSLYGAHSSAGIAPIRARPRCLRDEREGLTSLATVDSPDTVPSGGPWPHHLKDSKVQGGFENLLRRGGNG